MEEVISDGEIIESAVNVDDCMLDMVEKGFGIDAINGVVLARLLVLNRESDNEYEFLNFLDKLKLEHSLMMNAPKSLQ